MEIFSHLPSTAQVIHADSVFSAVSCGGIEPSKPENSKPKFFNTITAIIRRASFLLRAKKTFKPNQDKGLLENKHHEFFFPYLSLRKQHRWSYTSTETVHQRLTRSQFLRMERLGMPNWRRTRADIVPDWVAVWASEELNNLSTIKIPLKLLEWTIQLK